MTLDPWVLLAIAAMTLATFATRAGGYVLFKAFKPPPGLRAMLAYIPGTLFVAYVMPTLAQGHARDWVGAAVVVGVMLAMRNAAVAILGGTAATWLVWSWF